jgi:pimeloyl-ACP methyl ester carboxylesterase
MTTVFVHGVPETPALWDRLRLTLDQPDSVAVRLPGFGSPLPDGFDATKEAYVDWLVGELETISAGSDDSDDGGGQGVDIVGHDWGGGFVVRLVSIRPDLVRSWVTDAAGMGSGAFEWHPVAKIWQTPEAGEQFFAGWAAQPPEAVAATFESLGIPHDDALTMVDAVDETMASAILSLYRSAVDVGEEWSPEFRDIKAPGLVLVAEQDPYGSASRSRQGAERSGAAVAELEGLGHWWMLESPERVAPLLEEFWSRL